jgi:hypothetical protein
MLAVVAACGMPVTDNDAGDAPAEGPIEVSTAGPVVEAVVEPVAGSCIEFDDSGQQLAYNEFSDRAVRMGDDLSILAAEHSGQVAGLACCSDRQGLAAFIKPGAPEVERLLVDAAAQYPELRLEIKYVPRSLDEMQALVARVVEVGLTELGLGAIGPDIYTGGLLIEVQGYDEKADVPEDQAIAEAEAAVWAVVGDDVPLATTLATSEAIAM